MLNWDMPNRNLFIIKKIIMKDITLTFPGGKRVDAHYNGRTVETDQSVKNDGEGSAPEPFDLFFVSIATCVGIYVLEFCNTRKLNTDGLGVNLRSERDPKKKLFNPISIEVILPHNFPHKHKDAILAMARNCTVVKHIVMAANFDIVLVNQKILPEVL